MIRMIVVLFYLSFCNLSPGVITRKKAARAWERRQERSRPLQAGQVVARRSPRKTSQVVAPADDEPRMRRPRAARACKQP